MVSDSAIRMLGRIDNFWIIIALVIGSAIWEWLKKKGQSEQTGSASGESEPPHSPSVPRRTTTTPPAPAQRPAATRNWEEELRRLLSGEEPPPKPPPEAERPFQPVTIEQPHSAPPPLIARPPLEKYAPPPRAAPRMAAAERAVAVQLPALTESTTSYRRASHLHEETGERLKRVEEMTERHLIKVPTANRQPVSIEAACAISTIRNPGTARQAVIASLVFGPPKALEGE